MCIIYTPNIGINHLFLSKKKQTYVCLAAHCCPRPRIWTWDRQELGSQEPSPQQATAGCRCRRWWTARCPQGAGSSMVSDTIWAYGSNLGNSWKLRFTSRTSSNLERFHRLPRVCTKIMYGKLGGHRWQENLMIYLAPEGGLCFPFDQASSLQECELSEEVLLLEEVL